jgi:hypothetical protein
MKHSEQHLPLKYLSTAASVKTFFLTAGVSIPGFLPQMRAFESALVTGSWSCSRIRSLLSLLNTQKGRSISTLFGLRTLPSQQLVDFGARIGFGIKYCCVALISRNCNRLFCPIFSCLRLSRKEAANRNDKRLKQQGIH